MHAVCMSTLLASANLLRSVYLLRHVALGARGWTAYRNMSSSTLDMDRLILAPRTYAYLCLIGIFAAWILLTPYN
jgi:hypothetical protein